MVPLILSNFAFSWLYAYIFDQWAGVRTFVGGVLAGITIAIPLALAIDLQYLAFMNIYNSLLIILVDVIAIAVMNGIAGGVMGLIIGKMSPKS
jgi:O-antigen ligase